jgi:thymidine kinase
MARSFAKSFYHSRSWTRCRKVFMEVKHWTCERCGCKAVIVHHKKHISPTNITDPDITLNWDNLMAVCHKCHEFYHGDGNGVPEGYAFNEEGELIRRG